LISHGAIQRRGVFIAGDFIANTIRFRAARFLATADFQSFATLFYTEAMKKGTP
jgi:hypothetical protein